MLSDVYILSIYPFGGHREKAMSTVLVVNFENNARNRWHGIKNPMDLSFMYNIWIEIRLSFTKQNIGV